MIGVVIPAHNEEACLDGCLYAVRMAARHHALRFGDTHAGHGAG